MSVGGVGVTLRAPVRSIIEFDVIIITSVTVVSRGSASYRHSRTRLGGNSWCRVASRTLAAIARRAISDDKAFVASVVGSVLEGTDVTKGEALSLDAVADLDVDG